MTSKWYIIDDINPQPWAIGPLGVGRRPGGAYPYIGPNQQLQMYQKAIREQLADFEGLAWEGDVALEFYLWRRIEKYRKSQAHQSDTTNLQKGLEDALQGIFFENDRVVRDIRSVVVEQSQTTTSRIVIRVSPWTAFDPSDIPDFIWREIDNVPALMVTDNSWNSNAKDEDIF